MQPLLVRQQLESSSLVTQRQFKSLSMEAEALFSSSNANGARIKFRLSCKFIFQSMCRDGGRCAVGAHMVHVCLLTPSPALSSFAPNENIIKVRIDFRF